MDKPIVRGFCPVCNKRIMNQDCSAFINGGMEFWVEFSDKSRGQFCICEDCFLTVNQEQLDKIMQTQIAMWGYEIARQMEWYYSKAVHLRIIQHSREKDGLKAQH